MLCALFDFVPTSRVPGQFGPYSDQARGWSSKEGEFDARQGQEILLHRQQTIRVVRQVCLQFAQG